MHEDSSNQNVTVVYCWETMIMCYQRVEHGYVNLSRVDRRGTYSFPKVNVRVMSEYVHSIRPLRDHLLIAFTENQRVH